MGSTDLGIREYVATMRFEIKFFSSENIKAMKNKRVERNNASPGFLFWKVVLL